MWSISPLSSVPATRGAYIGGAKSSAKLGGPLSSVLFPARCSRGASGEWRRPIHRYICDVLLRNNPPKIVSNIVHAARYITQNTLVSPWNECNYVCNYDCN